MSANKVPGGGARAAGTARLPWALLIVAVVPVAVMLPLSLGKEPYFDTVFFGLLVVALGTVGAFVAFRQPANPIGWVFCGQAVWGGVVETWEAFAYNSLPTAEAGAWVIGWSWVIHVLRAVVTGTMQPAHVSLWLRGEARV